MHMKYKDQSFQPGSAAGRKRLQILTQVMAPSTRAFFQKVRFNDGMEGLDLGCGTGEVTLQLKGLVGSKGKMTGLDGDATNIKIARELAGQKGQIHGLEFRQEDISKWQESGQYDFVYSRLFFNLPDQPLQVLRQVLKNLKSGGFAMVEDLDFSSYYCFPDCYAYSRYVELFTEIKKRKGADVNIGSQLPSLFEQAGFSNIQVQVVRPAFLEKEYKHIASLTLEHIAAGLIQEQLTTPTELQALLFELKAFEAQKDTLITMPGIYQVWGHDS